MSDESVELLRRAWAAYDVGDIDGSGFYEQLTGEPAPEQLDNTG